MALVLLLVILVFWFRNKETNNKEQDQKNIVLSQILNQLKKLDRIEKEIKETKIELRKEMEETKIELRKEMEETKIELKKEIKETKIELRKEMEETKIELKKEINILSSQLNMSVQILSQNYAIEKLKDCSGLIKIFPSSKSGNTYACGLFIRIGNEYFFVTSLHAIYDQDTRIIREVNEIKLVNNIHLSYKNSVIMFDEVDQPDIALIPIKPYDYYVSYATQVNKDDNYIGQSLFYISKRQKKVIFGRCSVVEIPAKSKFIKTDCGGTHGSSGTGYVNEYGNLVAIHRGQSSFLEPSDDENYNPYLDIKKGLNESSKELIENPNESFTKVLTQSFKPLFTYFNQIIKYESRNPRAIAVSSKYIYDLFTNRTKNVKEVELGKYHVLKTNVNKSNKFVMILCLVMIFMISYLRIALII